MDSLTIQVLMPAVTAIVAGFGSAWLTASINRRNTKDTLAVTRAVSEEQWNRTQEREHAVWLRNEKKEAYMSFLTLAQEFSSRLGNADEDEDLELVSDELTTCRGAIKILGSSAVRTIARDIDSAISAALLAHDSGVWQVASMAGNEDEADPEAHDRFMEATKLKWKLQRRVTELFIDYVEAVREDLGTVTEDDELLNAGNRNRTNNRAKSATEDDLGETAQLS